MVSQPGHRFTAGVFLNGGVNAVLLKHHQVFRAEGRNANVGSVCRVFIHYHLVS